MQILKTRKKFVQGPRDFVQNQKISPIQSLKISPIIKDEPPPPQQTRQCAQYITLCKKQCGIQGHVIRA